MAVAVDARRAMLIFARVLTRTVVANVIGAVLTFVYLTDVLPYDRSETDLTQRAALVFFVVLTAILVLGAAAIGVAITADARGWAGSGRPPTERERLAVLAVPARMGALSLSAWLVGGMAFVVVNALTGTLARDIAAVAIGSVIGGAMTSAIAFLLVERILRPEFATLLAGRDVPERRHLSVRRRLMLTWAVAAGAPLVGIALGPIVRPVAERADIVAAVAVLAAIAFAAGAALTFGTASAVGDRILAVRRALERVGSGDLDAFVPVDDGGDLGLLQAGFNSMVEGLRERARIQDLFGRHVGVEVARRALDREEALGGEQRHASALFVDIIGSTGIAEARDPADVVALLNRFFDAVVRCVDAERGWVNKFEGDGALCVFGAPDDDADHAAHALRAARSLRASLDELAVEGIDAAIGVSSGPVVAGNVGASRRYEYTVIGDPVNEAARLSELAKDDPGRVFAGERAVSGAGAEARLWTRHKRARLRGRSATTVIYVPARATR